MELINGLGKKQDAEVALPPLADSRIEVIARKLCQLRGRDPDKKSPGGICLGDVVCDENWWIIERPADGSDPWVYTWMTEIEDADRLLKVMDYPRCETCSHWGVQNENDVPVCSNIKHHVNFAPAAGINPVTPADFGCINHTKLFS